MTFLFRFASIWVLEFERFSVGLLSSRLRCSRMEDCYEGLQFPSAILPTAQLALFMPPKLLRLGRPPASSTNRSTSTHVLSKSCRIACPIFGNPLAPAGLPWIEKQPHWLQKSPVSTRYGRSRSSLLHFLELPPTQTFELDDQKSRTTQPGTLNAQGQSFVKPVFESH